MKLQRGDLYLTAGKCVIFLITGKFQVGGVEVTRAGERYLVESEPTIQIQTYTAVAIYQG
jgi:hypothetical protein